MSSDQPDIGKKALKEAKAPAIVLGRAPDVGEVAQALLEAVSPNRDSIAGEAHSTIGTMFCS